MMTIAQTTEITAEQFLHLAAIGAFPEDQRFELIDGEIIEMPPSGPEHDGTSSQINEVLVLRFAGKAFVRPGGSLPVSDRSVPLPDFVVVRPRDDRYRLSHPCVDDVLLVVEVSDSSLPMDSSTKALRFAQAGVVEHWVVDVQHGRILVMREPSGNGYQAKQIVTRGQTIQPLAFPDITIAALDLLGPDLTAS